MTTNVFVRRIHSHGQLPSYANHGDGGADLYAVEEVVLPGSVMLHADSAQLPPRFIGPIITPVKVGIAIAIPDGYAGLILPRSGLASKHKITLINAPGLIDAGYRGELVCMMVNHGTEQYRIKRGDRIAQLMIIKVENAFFVPAAELSESVRGAGGFGSSGR